MNNKQSEETVTGAQADTHASLEDKHPNDQDDKLTDTKKRPRGKTNLSTTEVQPLIPTLRPN